jgi:hypothetical protein
LIAKIQQLKYEVVKLGAVEEAKARLREATKSSSGIDAVTMLSTFNIPSITAMQKLLNVHIEECTMTCYAACHVKYDL